MARVPVTCPPGFGARYTVQRGDSMFSIARRFGVSLNALIAANPHIPNPNLLFVGDVLCVPGPTSPRIPVSCPPGFQGRYTVQPGDSMFFIAQTFGVSLTALIAANPHIPNPAVLFPGDVLCVPGPPPVVVPCCVLLPRLPGLGLPPDAFGTALVRLLTTGLRSVSLLGVDIPPPGTFGNFDTYAGVVTLPPPESGAFIFPLTPSLTQPTTWAGTINFPLIPGFPPFPADITVGIQPFNTNTGNLGPAVLQNTLVDCR